MPTAEGEITNGSACTNWGGDCCLFAVLGIKVKHCGQYYIYYLQQQLLPLCGLAYCNGRLLYYNNTMYYLKTLYKVMNFTDKADSFVLSNSR